MFSFSTIKTCLRFSVELENLRQHNAILKGSSSSMGATPNHSLNDNGEYLLFRKIESKLIRLVCADGRR